MAPPRGAAWEAHASAFAHWVGLLRPLHTSNHERRSGGLAQRAGVHPLCGALVGELCFASWTNCGVAIVSPNHLAPEPVSDGVQGGRVELDLPLVVSTTLRPVRLRYDGKFHTGCPQEIWDPPQSPPALGVMALVCAGGSAPFWG